MGKASARRSLRAAMEDGRGRAERENGRRLRRLGLFNGEGDAGEASSSCYCLATEAAACPCERERRNGAAVDGETGSQAAGGGVHYSSLTS
jgi:hypothetical protein